MNLVENIFVFVVLLFAAKTGLRGESCQKRDTSTDNKPLILTPFIQKGQNNEAKTQSRVPSVLGMNLESYSGFFTVRTEGDANLFFWFFPALNDSRNKPLLLWMDGGPGLSSMYGNFGTVGSYFVTSDGKVNHRNVTWLSEFNILFIDTPVGAGFSYANSVEFYTNTTTLIAQDVVIALKQFFQVFSEFGKNDFYIAGESYAAKYAIVTADIITANTSSEINFNGLILTSPLFDPIHMLNSAQYQFQTSIIDKKQMTALTAYETEFHKLAKLGQYTLASATFYFLLNKGTTTGDYDDNTNILIEDIGIASSENILYDNQKEEFNTYGPFVETDTVRKAIHVGQQPFNVFSQTVLTGITQTGDLATPFTIQLQDVLNRGYKTILLSGNMDYVIPTSVVTDSIDLLVWNHAKQYAQTTRTVWQVNENDENTAGYITCAANLCFAIVRNAGHTIGADEPLRTLTVVERFVNNKPFNVSDGV